ncbi:MAG: bifunctional diaminohydroxyphosphoribosylaminopyrimidine deaminase/5-amino-6-(5-phosphoribosylamino)uracil reductase RibD [Algisphaera sp.]
MNQAQAMQRALELAARARGWVEPNPLVGCVMLRDGMVVGEGYHQRFGEAHAEVKALEDCRQRGVDTVGLTAVVTLEPCAHQGKTPPCVEALIAAKVGRVVVAMIDPDPRVAGRGVQCLRDAGIAVEVGEGEVNARELNAPFIKRLATGLPYVTLKWAQTLDGYTATSTGHSQWISGAASRHRVHELRACADVIMVGSGTFLADAPRLTARDVPVRRMAKRVIVDRRGRVPRDSPIFSDGGPPASILEGSLEASLRQFVDEGATHVLVEGGAELNGALLKAKLVDRVLVFLAPKLCGDPAAHPAVVTGSCLTMDDAARLTLQGVEPLQGDVMLDYRVPAES